VIAGSQEKRLRAIKERQKNMSQEQKKEAPETTLESKAVFSASDMARRAETEASGELTGGKHGEIRKV
jgi:hypothetical protein